MKSNYKAFYERSNYLFIAILILLILTWGLDYLFDSYYSGVSAYNKLFAPEPLDIAVHLVFFALQLALLVAVYFIYKKHRKLQRLLEATIKVTKEEKAKSDAIIAAIGEGLCILDRNLKIIYQNKVHMDLVGGDLAGSYCYQVYDGSAGVCPECPVALALQDGLIHKSEKQVKNHPNISDIEITASPLRDAAGGIIAGIEVVRDISKRKSAEVKLKKRTAAMEASIDGIAIHNRAGEFIYLNQAHARIYGYDTPEELLGKSWHVLYDEKEIQRFENEILPLLAGKGKWRGEAIARRVDGSTFPQEISLTIIDDIGLICVVRDITERKLAEKKMKKLNNELKLRASALAAANHELEAFCYSLSHDLRTPLTQIYSATQALQEVYPDRLDETGVFLLDTIGKASLNIEELIEAMLVLSQVTRSEMHSKPTNLSNLAQEIAAELRTSDLQRHVKFSIIPDLVVSGDVKLLRVALRNLLENAWKFTRMVDHALIEFGVIGNDGKTYFVRDNGIGFDMKDADKLFKPFQRLPGAREFFGTGIGLATVQRVIHLHGGEIWGEGTPGKGAAFFFTLAENHLAVQDARDQDAG
jgi:PAS domain S-box-containing protein